VVDDAAMRIKEVVRGADLLPSTARRLLVYRALVYFSTAVWLTKLYIHPASPATLGEFYRRLALGDLIPIWFVAGSAALFVVTATTLALRATTPDETL
jgi:hypothetical protein